MKIAIGIIFVVLTKCYSIIIILVNKQTYIFLPVFV